MINAITSKSTKAHLVAHIASLDAQLIAAGRTIAALREEKAMAAPASLFVAPPAMHKAYYEYVRTMRVLAKAQGKRVSTYQTFPQWNAAMRNSAGVSA